MTNKRLEQDFYLREDTLQLARELLGKRLVVVQNGMRCSGLISETEAYLGAIDRASHAYGNRLTQRTSTMFEAGGISYIYLCYGLHYLFNVVTHQKGTPHAILIRALIPDEGIPLMQERRQKNLKKPGVIPSAKLCHGPATVCQALGLDKTWNGISLVGENLFIENTERPVPHAEIQSGPRIGVDYAGDDALLPYRFVWQYPKELSISASLS